MKEREQILDGEGGDKKRGRREKRKRSIDWGNNRAFSGGVPSAGWVYKPFPISKRNPKSAASRTGGKNGGKRKDLHEIRRITTPSLAV